MKIKIKKMHPLAQTPTCATNGSACFDLYACRHYDDGSIGTGLAFEIPPGYAMMIYSRSGHGFKYGARLANCVGVIDSDYRGEVKVKLHVDFPCGFPLLGIGARIAQAMIIPVPSVEFEAVDDLSDTERGTDGFGSTGA